MLTAFIVSSIILFIAWVVFAEFVLERYERRHQYPLIKRLFVTTGAVIFILILDIPYNIVFGSIGFLQVPNKRGCGWTLSERLRYNLKHYSHIHWRWKVSYFTCKHLISPLG